MDFSHFAVLLLLVGLAILFSEVFLPSGGILGISAAACILGAIYCAWRAWYGESPTVFWTFIGAVVALVPVAVMGALWVFPMTPIGKRVLPEAPRSEDVTPYAEEQRQLRALIGATGTTLSFLGPGGLVRVDGRRMHCVSAGMFIEPNETVHVVDVRGNNLVVRPGPPPAGDLADEEDEDSLDDFADGGDDSRTADEEPPLDFPVSQG